MPAPIVAPVQASGTKVTAMMRLLDREREHGAHLIAVQRPVAGGIHPARAVAVPVPCRGRARRSVFAGSIVVIAGAARPEILAEAAAEEPLEAEAAFELHRLVRVAFAGGDGIAKSGDEDVAHRDLGRDALRRAVAERDVDGGDGGAARRHAQLDLLIARRGGLLATVRCRHRSSRRSSASCGAGPEIVTPIGWSLGAR